MTVSQVLNHINDNNYDDDITVTDIPDKHFLAVAANVYDPNNGIRDIKVELLPLDNEHRSAQTVNSGLYVKQQGEKSVKATVYQDEKALANNTQDY